MSQDTSRISISAHYTGYVWYKNGLSRSEFVTRTGQLANTLISPINAVMKGITGAHMDVFLLQRHLVLDHLLSELIEQGVEQVVELAAGLSPRGFRISEKYSHITYIETDLPGMATRKSTLLKSLKRPERHRVMACNILADSGEDAISSILNSLDKNKKTVILSEGLVNYFPLSTIRPVWSKIAKELKAFPEAYYLSDLYPNLLEHPHYRYVKMTQKLVELFTRGKWPLHYNSNAEIKQGFLHDGFSQVDVLDPAQFYQKLKIPQTRNQTLVRLIKARA